MNTENTFQFPLYKDDPLSFIDTSVLALTQVQDVFQLNEVLSAFLSEDVQNFVDVHKESFFLLSQVWNDAIQRIVLDVDDIIFPDGLLMIPPIFQKLDWVDHADSWSLMHKKYASSFENEPCLPFSLALLFIEAMQGNMSHAIDQFIEREAILNDDDTLHAERYLSNLQFFGWPMLEKAV